MGQPDQGGAGCQLSILHGYTLLVTFVGMALRVDPAGIMREQCPGDLLGYGWAQPRVLAGEESRVHLGVSAVGSHGRSAGPAGGTGQ